MGIPTPPAGIGDMSESVVFAGWSYGIDWLLPWLAPLLSLVVGVAVALWIISMIVGKSKQVLNARSSDEQRVKDSIQ